MMANPYILLWLEGPLQSWGFDSRFNRRDTLDFPTRSGVMGMICAALGYGGAQEEFLAEFLDGCMLTLAFSRTKRDKLAPRQPLLQDFHMVGSGYNENDPWQKLLTPKTSKGGKPVGGGSKLTYRYYLQDSAFAIIMEVPASRIDVIKKSMIAPVWDLYLGRKCCVPTEFIYQGSFSDIKEAEDKANEIAGDKKRLLTLSVKEGVCENGDDTITINDIPLAFGENKRYKDRQVTLFYKAGKDEES